MNRRELLQASAALLLPVAARAQAYPSKPIRYIVPVAAGGGNDMIARVVTERWGRALGQQFIVENQGGGGGVIACMTTARAASDGYTLMQGYVATHGTTPATRHVPYDAIKDFTPIGMIGATPNVLVVNSALPVKTLAEFIDYVRRNPGRINYGSAGPGSLTHLTMELFKQQIGAFMLHIPYRGIAPAFTDLLGGQTQAMFPGLAAALPHLRSGRVRALAVTGRARSAQLKDVPTLEESGFKGFDVVAWTGLFAPAHTPPVILERLSRELDAVLRSDDVRDRLAEQGAVPGSGSAVAFAGFIEQEQGRYARIVKAANIHD